MPVQSSPSIITQLEPQPPPQLPPLTDLTIYQHQLEQLKRHISDTLSQLSSATDLNDLDPPEVEDSESSLPIGYAQDPYDI